PRRVLRESPAFAVAGLVRLAMLETGPLVQYGFLFPGRESGLFGAFFELAEIAGARLFPADLVPDIENEAGEWAVRFLKSVYQEKLAPEQLPEWHYDKIHEFFRAGRVVMMGDW